jgi:hypothetical protein
VTEGKQLYETEGKQLCDTEGEQLYDMFEGKCGVNFTITGLLRFLTVKIVLDGARAALPARMRCKDSQRTSASWSSGVCSLHSKVGEAYY